MTPDPRELAAYHEAGHAAAVEMRGGGSLRSVSIRAHGEGLTLYSAKRIDIPFIAYAGCWAEARRLWEQRDADEDWALGDGIPFDVFVVGVLLSQPEDAARAYAFEAGARDLRLLERVWQTELERRWGDIDRLAREL